MNFVLDVDIQFKEHSLRELAIIFVNIILLSVSVRTLAGLGLHDVIATLPAYIKTSSLFFALIG